MFIHPTIAAFLLEGQDTRLQHQLEERGRVRAAKAAREASVASAKAPCPEPPTTQRKVVAHSRA